MGFEPALEAWEVEQAFGGRFTHLVPVQVGGQGAVFKGQAMGTGEPGARIDVAIKLYHPDQLDERSAREVKALQSIHGDTIVRLHAAGTCRVRGDECPFVATDFVDGEVLAARLAGGPLPIPEVARVGSDVALAIEILWGRRIVHRDIKPTNVMMAANGRAVLIDLGLARHLSLASLTTSGKTWGTAGYLSPEQAQASKQLSCKSDIFALGIVMQECLLGRHPTNRRQASLLNGGVKTSQLRNELPAEFAALVDAMVGKRAVHRPLPSVVVQRLAPFLVNSP